MRRDPGFKKPFWPTLIAASVFGLLMIVGFEIGRSAGSDTKTKATTSKAKATEYVYIAPTTAAPTSKPATPTTKAQPTKAPPTTKPATPPPTTKPETPTPPATKPTPTPEPTPTPPVPPTVPPEVTQVSFKDKILPIFKAKCIVCHGDPVIKVELDLRSLASIAKNKESIVAGNLMKSSVWLSVDEGTMPPPGKEKLTDSEKLLIKNWILSGAK